MSAPVEIESKHRYSAVWDAVFIVLIALFTIALFPRAALLREALFYFDISWQNFPMRAFFTQQLAAGRLGQWCTNVLCGFPLFAEGQGGPLYPLYFLFFPFMTTWKAYNLTTLLHIFLAGVFMYLYLRLVTRSSTLLEGRVGAFAGAVSFAFSGFFIQHAIHLNIIASACWTPLLFYLIERGFRERKAPFFLLPVVVISIQVLVGHPPFLFYSLLATGCYFIYLLFVNCCTFASRLKGLFLGIGIVALGLCIGAVQMFHLAELSSHSVRSEVSRYEFMTSGSYPPALVSTLAVPEIFGNRATDTEWFNPYLPYHESVSYCGVIVLLCALFAFMRLRSSRLAFFAIFSASAFILMLGKYTVLYRILQYVPVFNQFREPLRFNLFLIFGLSFMASEAINYLLSVRKLTATDRRSVCICTVIIVVSVLAIFFRSYGGRFPAGSNAGLLLVKSVVTWDLIRSGLSIFAALVLILLMSRLSNPVRIMGIIALVLIDLYTFGWYKNPTIKSEYFTKPPEHIAFLKAQPGVFRIYSEITDNRWKNPGWRLDMAQYDNALGNLEGYTPIIYNLDAMSGLGPMELTDMRDFLSNLTGGKVIFLNTQFILTQRDLSGAGLRKVFSDDGGNHIFENPAVLPRAFLVHNVEVMEAHDQALDRLNNRDFPYHLIGLTERRPQNAVLLNASTGTVNPGDDVEITTYEPGKYVMHTESSLSSLLIVSETFYPGWQVKIDGNRGEILRTNYCFLGIEIPEGAHEVELCFRSKTILYGMILSLIGCAVFVGLFLLFRARTCTFITEKTPSSIESGRWKVVLIIIVLLLLLLSAAVERTHWKDAFPRFDHTHIDS